MKVLIIGANSILSKKLIQLHTSDEVDILYHGAALNTSHPKHRNIALEDIGSLEDNYDIVYIVSAVISNEIEKLDEIINVNARLVNDICNRFKSSKIIYFSSVAVYDAIDGLNIDEKTLPCPESVYGISKLLGEKIVEKSKNYAILRISSMYGIGMKQSTFLPKIIKNALDSKEIRLLGQGQRIQNYIHARDVATLAKTAALSKQNGIFLAVSKENYTNKQIAEIIQAITSCSIEYYSDDHTRSVSYTQEIIPYNEYNNTSIENGIKKLIEWIKKQS